MSEPHTHTHTRSLSLPFLCLSLSACAQSKTLYMLQSHYTLIHLHAFHSFFLVIVLLFCSRLIDKLLSKMK